MSNSFYSREDIGKLILRLTVGILLLLHGIGKLQHGIDFIEQVVTGAGLPSFVAYGVYIGEVLAPIALIIGFKTRLAAWLVTMNMILAVSLARSGDIGSLTGSGGWALELEAFYFFGALAISYLGAGRYSLSRGR